MLRSGFNYEGQHIKSKEQIADALILERNLGIRIEDILDLRLCDFVKDGKKFRIDIVEQKTQKKREFPVPLEVMNYIQSYCIRWGISSKAKLFPFRERNVQKYLKWCVTCLD